MFQSVAVCKLSNEPFLLITNSQSYLDNPNVNWKAIVTSLLVGKYAFETYINYRQYQVYHNKKAPASIEKEISPEVFLKSQAYSRAKSRFGFFADAIDLLKELAVVKFDVLPRLWSVAGCISARLGGVKYIGGFFGASVMLQSLVFFAVNTVLSTLEELPLSYYKTFILEQQWGFNKTTVGTFVKDTLKSLILGLTISSPFIYLFLRIIDAYGTAFVKYAMGLTLAASLIIMTLVPTLILPLFYKMTPLEEGELRTEIEALAKRNNFPLTHLYVIDGSTRSSHSNAMFVGLPWSKKILLYDTLIEQSTVPQVVAVLAHEIGHWKLNHLPQMLAVSQATVASTFILFSTFLTNRSLFKSFGFPANAPPMIAFILFSYVSSPLNCFFQFINNLLSRKNEYQADGYAQLQGYKDELSTSLITMSTENLSSMNTDWLFSSYNHSHPILADRLSALGYKSQEKVGNIQVDIEKKESDKTEKSD